MFFLSRNLPSFGTLFSLFTRNFSQGIKEFLSSAVLCRPCFPPSSPFCWPAFHSSDARKRFEDLRRRRRHHGERTQRPYCKNKCLQKESFPPPPASTTFLQNLSPPLFIVVRDSSFENGHSRILTILPFVTSIHRPAIREISVVKLDQYPHSMLQAPPPYRGVDISWLRNIHEDNTSTKVDNSSETVRTSPIVAKTEICLFGWNIIG